MLLGSKIAGLVLIEFGPPLQAVKNTQLIEHCVYLLNLENTPETAALNAAGILSISTELELYVCKYQVCFKAFHFNGTTLSPE